MSPIVAEVAKELFDIKPDVSSNYLFIEDTWSALAPVKFKPTVELDPGQAPSEDANDSFEEKFSARIAGVRLASASSSAQSVDSVEVPPKIVYAIRWWTQRRRKKY